MRVTDLIASIDSDAKESVKAAYSRWNQTIRDALRAETALRFGGGKLNDSRSGDEVRPARISVSTQNVGYPEQLSEFEVPDQHELAARLAPHIPALRKLKASAREIERFFRENADKLEGVALGAGPSDLEASRSLADQLLRIAESYNLVQEILRVHGDILGVYRPPSIRGARYGGSSCSAYIDLYWGIIALVAKCLDVSTDSLSIVVATHELAHGVTHLGLDTDRHRWPGDAFQKCEPALVEGLAQYYTALVAERLEARAPGVYQAYESLLKNQPAIYRTHLPWVSEASPEIVRSALVACRRSGVCGLEDFEVMLGRAADVIRT